MAKALFCMEQTGIYCNHLLNSLKEVKANISLENALHIKNSLGLIRGKYDKIDAIRIARYAQKNSDEIKLWVPKRPVLLQLSHLFTLRSRLVTISHTLRTPLKEQQSFIKSELQNQGIKSCRKSVEAIKGDLADIDLNIEMSINSDERLRRLKMLITSVPGVGLITAIQIIISTNEYKTSGIPKSLLVTRV
jgi:transposase